MFSNALSLLFEKYIGLNTSLPSGENYQAAISLLQKFLSTANFETTTIAIPDSVAGKPNRVNLIARRFTNKPLPTLLIYNHIDTVPAIYPDAFKLIFKEGKAYGRGAADHKGSTVAVLDALEKLKNKIPRFNIVFLATTDEETEQRDQLQYISKFLNLPINTVIFNPDTFAGGTTVAHLSHLSIALLVKGKSAHSGMSHLGKNAIEEATKLIHFFLCMKKEFESQISKFVTFPTLGTKFICSRCNVTMIQSGIATNVIPDSCSLTIDFRFIPEKDVIKEKQAVLKRIDEFARKENIDYEVKNSKYIESETSDTPVASEFNSIYEKTTGEGGLYCVMGSSPVAEWAKHRGYPHFGIGVVRKESSIHGINEFAYIKDIENLSSTVKQFVMKS